MKADRNLVGSEWHRVEVSETRVESCFVSKLNRDLG
jgi:hypothetical protein